MFELNQQYTNRKGNYIVTAMDGDRMTVRYEDGTTANLRMDIQFRIWENIRVDLEGTVKKKPRITKSHTKARHYLKTVNTTDGDGLVILGLKRRIAVALTTERLSLGDRLIYFAIEPKVYFAIATVNGKPKNGKSKTYFFGPSDNTKVKVHPLDIDAHLSTAEVSISVDRFELESLPNFREKLQTSDAYFAISEDDFEIISDAIVEINEEELEEKAAAKPVERLDD